MLVDFIYSKDYGTAKKGVKRKMHDTTAKALEAHGIGSIEGVKKESTKKEK